MNLQKQLFLEEMLLVHVPGWELLQENDLLAFKAPGPVPFMNDVYGSPSLDAYQKLKRFYRNQSFTWFLSAEQTADLLVQWGFTGPELTFEMSIDLTQYSPPDPPAALSIREVQSSTDYAQWINTASGWLKIESSIVDHFFTPLIDTGKYIPYLGFYEGRPAATSLVYCGNLGAAMYCLGTLPDFRHRGLGSAVTHACLKAAKKRKIASAVLYGSQMGKVMYEKIGFQLMQTFRQYTHTT